ncbi:unnamed protein product [Caenorhabditis bovis]|uniref:phosphoenolpyruvate carboxykinase (GTP) n=1 Tax=Caenorhabditis bovis TaxID=2654633 RepID=A0A8S1FAD4_9PELO|nr:unnamed protein product [Caenorhabditis bovis]
MIETDCPTCKYPVSNSRDNRLAIDLQERLPKFNNTIYIPNYGNVPVTNGDLSWINGHVMTFVIECVGLMRPCAIRICNGSVFEAKELKELIVAENDFQPLKNLNRFCTDSVEFGPDRIYVVVKDKSDEIERFSAKTAQDNSQAIYDDNSPKNMSAMCFKKYKEQNYRACMTGRTMYVVPYSMGLIGGRSTMYGVQITDDPIFVLNLRTTFRVSSAVWHAIGTSNCFIKGAHSIGSPRPIVRKVPTPKSHDPHCCIVHQLNLRKIWVFGPTFGRSARFANTIAVRAVGFIGLKEKTLALNAAILEIRNPAGATINVCFASSEPLERLDLAKPAPSSLAEWRIDVVARRIAWLKWRDNKMFAISPENEEMNMVPIVSCAADLIENEKKKLDIIAFNPQSTKWSSDLGVPISGIVFGDRRYDRVPIVFEANSWQEGVVLTAGYRSHVQPKSGASKEAKLDFENNPMGMRNDIGFNFGKFVEHWLQMGCVDDDKCKPPLMFHINLFQEDDGKPIWPSSGENIRIFEWIFKRCADPSNLAIADVSAIGKTPKALNLDGLATTMNTGNLLKVDVRFWLEELARMRAFFSNHISGNKPKQVEQVLLEISSKL